MCFFNGNSDGIHSIEKKERMHDVVGPGPNLFPCSYAKAVARVEGPRILRFDSEKEMIVPLWSAASRGAINRP
jgi:hypothetical protein